MHRLESVNVRREIERCWKQEARWGQEDNLRIIASPNATHTSNIDTTIAKPAVDIDPDLPQPDALATTLRSFHSARPRSPGMSSDSPSPVTMEPINALNTGRQLRAESVGLALGTL